ncbi:elongator complex protein [Sodiomyces alkalinus F11]|uniref:Elongator complex protein 2 n=1 Tax=Sodiomyces alkalinus (strain CBS 110278 / VKM F-3762 / F11) TaxID=1314773 RepID=A0A3N2PXG0_SODAK|nr:elongator complex protein [Sodiomyces alkalinus F11]ROT39177.1 elongator complex protein [Sodiomyces alkalinus F11]
MTGPQVLAEYLSTGANRHTAVADWSQSGALAFGADSNIAVWSPSAESNIGITAILSGHKDVVKAVKFLTTGSDDGAILLSGSDDRTLKLWSLSSDLKRGVCLQTANEHTSPINCISVLRPRDPSAPVLVASGAADATIKIWSLSSNQLQLLQTIKPNPKFLPLALALTALDNDEDVFVLAAAGTRDTIQIFLADAAGKATPEFALQATLTGHEGWIRSLDFTRESGDPQSDLLLASASQDKYIRLWRFHRGSVLPALAADADPSSGAYLPGKSPSNKAHKLHCAGKDFSVTFEALLLGHEDWIYNAKWFNHGPGKLQLLSTSADNSLAIWEAEPASGIWLSVVRLGEISREKGATTATGSIGGFWTGLWGPDGKSVACLGRTGSWRRWVYNGEHDEWQPAIAISGHTKPVTGISWSGNGDYLVSTSTDQTTRLHGQWRREQRQTWHEMSRPQIHGYDLNCIDTLGPSQFVSGADEKLMRVFSKPRAVAKMLSRLSGSSDAAAAELPDGANMPVLGLSNKAIDAVEDDVEVQPDNPHDRDSVDPASIVRKSALEIDRPPFEESLSRHTLWPEIEKLYGHGYELSCLAASHDGKLIASACKASSLNHAVIRIFETERWTEVKPPLQAHNLTVTRLRFSPDDKYLLSVGRDRQWAVFGRDTNDLLKYELVQSNPKGHSRMILDAAWAPCEQGRVFVTAGRDKRVKIWGSRPYDAGGKVNFTQQAEITCDTPVTAVDFLGHSVPQGGVVLALGTEAGRVSLYSVTFASGDTQASRILQLPDDLCLPKPVSQLAWRPSRGVEENNEKRTQELAIAGEDSSLRIYRFLDLETVGSR